MRTNHWIAVGLAVAVVCAAVAVLAGLRVRHWAVVGGVLAAVLLVGSATKGSAAVSYRISHPTHPLGFAEDWLQLLGEAAALAAALVAVARTRRRST